MYYETDTGDIVKVIGVMTDIVQYFNHKNVYSAAPIGIIASWKPRADLTDFQNALDPILPVEFDRDYDVKYYSQLKQALNDPDMESVLRDLMKKYKITLKSVNAVKGY